MAWLYLSIKGMVVPVSIMIPLIKRPVIARRLLMFKKKVCQDTVTLLSRARGGARSSVAIIKSSKGYACW